MVGDGFETISSHAFCQGGNLPCIQVVRGREAAESVVEQQLGGNCVSGVQTEVSVHDGLSA